MNRNAVSPAHPAFLIAALAAAACILITVTRQLTDTDMWQHLAVGKAIWQLKQIPTTNLWSWPTYGAPDVNAPWLFRALIFPVWESGGVWGLFVWRWLTTLAAFTLLWFVARRLGARGFAPLLVLALYALTWRHDAQVQPETLVGILLAAQLWILETRRGGGADRTVWLIPIAWIWANLHASFALGILVTAIYAIGDLARGAKAGGGERSSRLGLIALGTVAISFLNPSGWRAVWEPFDFVLNHRQEMIYRSLPGLQPLFPAMWLERLPSGLPFLVLLWPLLLAWRGMRKGLDLVETLVCAAFTLLLLAAVRLAGVYALVAAPFVARDLDDLIRARKWPAWTSPVPVRALLVIVACVFVSLPAWTRAGTSIGVGLIETHYPQAACDFIEENGVQGRSFNPFYLGGYMLWRFWPDEHRLPFMDNELSGGRLERERYARMFMQPGSWPQFRDQYLFDYVLLDAAQDPRVGDVSRDVLDADTTYALVFRDDASALYVRRVGGQARLAREAAYRLVPGGERLLGPLGQACEADSGIRAGTRIELQRMVRQSRWNSRARSLLANLDLIEGNYDDAQRQLEAALEIDPALYAGHERLGIIAMQQERWQDAVRELELERELTGGSRALSGRLARSWQAVGDQRKARKYYGEVFDMAPSDPALADSISARGDSP